MKGMSNKTKIILIKIATVIALTAMVIVVPGSFIYAWFLPGNVVYGILGCCGIVFAISGICLLIFVFAFHIEPEPVKPDKTPLLFQDFETLDEHLRQVLGESRYQSHPGIVLDDQSTMWIFTRKHKLSELDLFTVIRTSELQKDFMDDVANDAVTEFLQGYYQKGQITDSINMMAFVCVDRVSPAFYEFINTPLEQGMKNGRFLAGASFGGKILYIGRQEDGFAIAKYKRLRREFLRVVGVDDVK